jgi:virginiamycin B lyase
MNTGYRSGLTSRQYSRRWMCVLLGIVIGIVLVGAVLLWPWVEALAVGVPQAGPSPTVSAESGDSFVFRFDPALEAFEAFTIPTAGAAPDGIAVFERPGPSTEVWFAESGADRIGRLVYTGTTDYTWREYGLPAGSRPLNVVVERDDGSINRVWFTENGRNRIGCVDAATGITREFAISTTDVAPYDLDIAPDDSIWFTERATDRIGKLVVTPTAGYEYEVREFHVGRSDAGLSGIAVESNDRIWAVLSNHDRLARLQPSVVPPRVDRTGPITATSVYPFKLSIASDDEGVYRWVTELDGNHVSLLFGTTLEDFLRYPVPTPNSHPYALDVDSTGAVWFSEQLGGKIGRLVLTPTATFTEFPVPLPQARIQGLAVDSDDVVWFVADTWYTVNLPLIIRQ